jgi:hypothetical protein
MDMTHLARQLATIRSLNGYYLMLEALRRLVAQSTTVEDLKILSQTLRAERDAAAPNGYAMRPTLSPWFQALREVYGESMEALYVAREGAGLSRYEVNCGSCPECLAAAARIVAAPGGVQ